MDFGLTDEQRLLKESVERLLAAAAGTEARRSRPAEATPSSGGLWARMADLGLAGLPFAEDYGGSSGGPVETMIVMEAVGKALARTPFLATVLLGGVAVQLAGNGEQRRRILPAIASGSLTMALAAGERQSRYDLFDVATTARRGDRGWVLEGEKSLVLDGDAADLLVVSARVEGRRRDAGGIGLFVVPTSSPGLSRRGYQTQDDLRAAEISLSSVTVAESDVLAGPERGLAQLEQVVDGAIAALAAEAVGALAELVTMTVDYLKTRRQFGTAIGSFQALQHRAVDMHIAVEQARSMAMLAAMVLAEADPSERTKVVSATKVQLSRAIREVGQQAIQLHGGIGMTMEYRAGHYFKRLTMIDRLFGDGDHHLGRLARLGSLIEARA